MNRGWTLRWVTLTAMIIGLSGLPLLGGDADSVQVGWAIASSQTLSVAGAEQASDRQAASTFTVPEPSDADLARGHVDREDALRLKARSNTDWIITARSERGHMGTSFDGRYTKPIRDLQVRADGGAYTPLSQNERIIARGTPGHETVSVDYRVEFDPTAYRPGSYRATVIYTISTP